jgi:hypothetical protein
VQPRLTAYGVWLMGARIVIAFEVIADSSRQGRRLDPQQGGPRPVPWHDREDL